MNAVLLKDGYKVGHPFQYPDKTELVYSNFTPRGSRIEGLDHVVVFGIQAFSQRYLIDYFNQTFFDIEEDIAVAEYKRTVDAYLGKDSVSVDHIRALHRLGYLPLEIRALPEGTRCPMRVPVMTLHNTDPNFGWVTNMVETLLSTSLWGPMTSATIADRFRGLVDKYQALTGGPDWFSDFQMHDFSMRGMNGLEAAEMSGAGHLLSGLGTDSIPAIMYLEKYYDAGKDGNPIGMSVPATEHSVMCAGGQETEEETFRRLIGGVYPSGIISIVSDTWDFWEVVTELLPKLKRQIMARDGKVVIRPDSGDPIKIICGDPDSDVSHIRDGLIQTLYNIFGGEFNGAGFIELDEHIGAIYGDSITYDRAENILSRLAEKGFASSNVVFGVGSYTYQYNTRDTFGFAMKATGVIIDGEEMQLFKDPVTDSGLKKSAKGFLQVVEEEGELVLVDELNFADIDGGLLQPVFRDGEILNFQTLTDIRARLKR